MVSENGKTILDEAGHLTAGDRQAAYGHPRDNHGCTASMLSAYLVRRGEATIDRDLADKGVCVETGDREFWLRVRSVLPYLLTVDDEDVCMFNVLQKVSRHANFRKRDNYVDIAGYARNGEQCGE